MKPYLTDRLAVFDRVVQVDSLPRKEEKISSWDLQDCVIRRFLILPGVQETEGLEGTSCGGCLTLGGGTSVLPGLVVLVKWGVRRYVLRLSQYAEPLAFCKDLRISRRLQLLR